jgi:type I restriction enzyme, S subunit
MAEWRECKLGDICDVRDGTHDSTKQHPIGKPLVTSKNLKNGNIDLENTYLISDEDFLQINKRSKVDQYDILFSMIGTVGEIAIVKDAPDFAIKNVGLFRCNRDYDLSKWIYYYMKSSAAKEELGAALKGSTQAYIALGDLRKFPVLLPSSKSEQNAITSVLSSLDDKIDLLHRQNKTLEAMAEALFRQWFVEDARDDWRDGRLGDVIELHYGKALKSEGRTGSGFPVVGSSGIVDYHSEFLVTGPGIVIGRKGTLGKVIYLWDSFYPIDTTYYVKSKVKSAGLLYEYFLLKTITFEEMNTDSAVPGLNRDIALSTEIKIAPENKLHSFNALVATFVDKLKRNNDQIHTLEKLRDTLLSKLMSGEVRVAYEH